MTKTETAKARALIARVGGAAKRVNQPVIVHQPVLGLARKMPGVRKIQGGTFYNSSLTDMSSTRASHQKTNHLGQQSITKGTTMQYMVKAQPSAKAGPLALRGIEQLWANLGNTEDGRKWAMSALHPCDDALDPPAGVPDHTQVTSVTPSFRNTTSIAAPTDVPTGSTWDLQVIMVPAPEVDYLWRYRTSAAVAWSAWRIVRPSTFQASADGSAITMGSSGYSRYRYQGRGYTFHHIASATTNEGVIVAGQVDGRDGAPFPAVSAVPKNTGQQSNPVQVEFSVPSDPQELTQTDSLAVEWNAYEGAYMPLRFPDPQFDYKDTAKGGIVTFNSDPAGNSAPESYFIVKSATINGGTVETNQIVSEPTPTFVTPPDIPSASQMGYGCSYPGNLYTGVIFFLGIDKLATIQVKSRMHLQCQADPRGYAVQPFVHSSPLYDPLAREIVAKVGQVQKHAYYASYNDLSNILGSIWGAIKSVASPILKPIGDIVGDVPIVGGLVKGLGQKIGILPS